MPEPTPKPRDALDWNGVLAEQLEWHWNHHLRRRFEGLTDEEYLWEPVRGCWSVRPRGTHGPEADGAVQLGAGPFVLDYADPEPVPAPVTTIAWRIAHLVVGVFGQRNASHFGGPAMDYAGHRYAGTAAEALDQLEEAHARWRDGVAALGAEGLLRRCGPAEGPYAEASLAELVVHINREAIHHGAEICLLRDLYAHTGHHGAR
ncbi:DinB family protein [Zafaria sp. J156]|uniref:DinB family protein n=1 Tax=Zafaria sp. J156 TaxID=3116490 RepID=UPI002E7A5DF3|nr:DinB family protein [Zafaria sp. J156]MEE1621478.1 DinB family protein [Zafaria sp. J156]